MKVTSLPITAKLVPRSRNLLYLLEIAAVTRLAIGGLRVLQNSPDRYKSQELTEYEKRKSYLERIFIELFGTVGYMAILHLGQDGWSKAFYEGQESFSPPKLKKELSEMSRGKRERINGIMLDVFGHDRQGIISRVLYGQEKTVRVLDANDKYIIDPATRQYKTRVINQKATLSTLREKLKEVLDADTLAKVEKHFIKPRVEPYVRKLYKASSMSVLAGVLGSAIFGGVVIQWINDNIFSPLIVPPLIRMFYGKKDLAMGRENNPEFQQSGPMSAQSLSTGPVPSMPQNPQPTPQAPFVQQAFPPAQPNPVAIPTAAPVANSTGTNPWLPNRGLPNPGIPNNPAAPNPWGGQPS